MVRRAPLATRRLPPRRGVGDGGACGDRRRGIGSRLLSATLAAARDAALLRVELEVYASNTVAIALYERSGFYHEGRKINARLFNGAFDDVLLMGLRFDGG